MAHELEVDPVTGEIPMFFHGELPWHGLGQTLQEDRPATAAEAIKLAHLDWDAVKYPMYAMVDGVMRRVPGTHAVVRGDTSGARKPVMLTSHGKAVSDQYEPLQNIEAFDFFDEVVGQGAAVYHTAGALRNGERIWILAKLPDTLSILGMDDIEPYLLLTNSHDGTSSIQVMFTTVRVVCANTLRMGMNSGMREMKIRHTASAKDKLNKAAELMGIVSREVKEAETIFTDMARVQMTSAMLKDYFAEVYPEPQPDAETGEIPERTAKNYNKRLRTLNGIFERGAGSQLATAHGTLFGAFNAVTDYVDHYTRGKDADVRMQSVLMGHGDGIKQRAFNIATDRLVA